MLVFVEFCSFFLPVLAVVFQGFLDLKIAKWLRAVITRGTAIIPSFTIALIAGEKGADDLIVFSQVRIVVFLLFDLAV